MKITTDRLLLLRPFEPPDVDFFAAISADPEVMRYIGGGPISRQKA
jgi:RimJ/RimL family protein N-acetyltransferase